jgi:hypothetical protein
MDKLYQDGLHSIQKKKSQSIQKQDNELKDCTFKPKVLNQRPPRSTKEQF